jgi:hypothetical protein
VFGLHSPRCHIKNSYRAVVHESWSAK